jgi:hypothetical protein
VLLVEQPAFNGRQAHKDGELVAWPLLHKRIEHCATPTAVLILPETVTYFSRNFITLTGFSRHRSAGYLSISLL